MSMVGLVRHRHTHGATTATPDPPSRDFCPRLKVVPPVIGISCRIGQPSSEQLIGLRATALLCERCWNSSTFRPN